MTTFLNQLHQSKPSCKRRQLPRICTKVPGVADRGCQPEPEWKSLTLEYVNTKYPKDQWTHAYTDGSAAEAIRDWGGGVYIRYNDRKAHITIATEKYSTKFKAEADTLKKPQLRSETTYPKPSPMWSSSQMLSLSSANSKTPARGISTRWKLSCLTSLPGQT